jgi:hypothetical protein
MLPVCPGDARRLCGARVDNLNSTAATVEMHESVDQRVEREIAALANPSARVKSVADLADEDVSGSNLLTAESLYAEALRVGITPVSARALSFFMCHGITSPRELPRGRAGPAEAKCLLIKGLRYRIQPGYRRRRGEIDGRIAAAAYCSTAGQSTANLSFYWQTPR